MRISKKCYYALRALFELALRQTAAPVAVAEIASAQDIPARFLETILNELRHAGRVISHRGNAGGYSLAVSAEETTVADIVQVMEGSISVVAARDKGGGNGRYLCGDSAFEEFWGALNDSITQVCRQTSLADLVKQERMSENRPVPDYVI